MKKPLQCVLLLQVILCCCLKYNAFSSEKKHLVEKEAYTANVNLKLLRNAPFKKEVHGTIRDSVGTVPGVSVMVKGTTTGTTTDFNGKYILDVPGDNSVLVFSMIGYVTQEIPVAGHTVIDVTMKPVAKGLNEVVIVGFGTQKKNDLIGAVTTINPSELKVPSSNLTTALAGRLSGVIAYQRSGEPGQDNASFFIRGVTTFGYKKDPLILIDGVELSTTELARTQPDDIASFSILKDATSTAVYGARGANGVILVTTKQGKEGKAKVNFRLENSISAPTTNVQLADPITYMQLENEAYLTRNPLQGGPYSQSKIDNTIKGTNSYFYPATDWRKALFKDYTMNQRANFNVSGGSQVAKYYIAGSLNQDNGVLKVDKKNNFNSNIDLKSYLLRANTSISVTKTTEVGVRLYGSFDDYTGPIDGGAGMYQKVMRTNPVLFSPYYENTGNYANVPHILFGNAIAESSGTFVNGYLNPYADMVKGYKNYSRSLMLAQFELKQDLQFITEGLTFRAMGNTNRTAYFDVSRYYNPFFYQAGNFDKATGNFSLTELNPNTGTEYLGYSEGAKTIQSQVYLESVLNYSRTFDKKHAISGLLVYMLNNQLVGNASSLQQSLPSRNLGLSGRATYAYDSRYIAEFNFGYNGSEKFYQTERFGFFPSVGGAWVVSNESFFKPFLNTVSKLKLRATYGLVGNDAIGSADDRFFYLSVVNMNDAAKAATFGTDFNYTLNGVTVSRYDNKDITWEVAKKTNLGLEVSLFDKFNLQADFFKENRNNILMTRASIPTTIGNSAAVRANVGKASSKGVDMSLDYSTSFSNGTWLTARGNFTYVTSRFDVYEEPQYPETYLSHVGRSLSQRFGYVAERLFVDDNEAKNSPIQFGTPGVDYGGGDIKYRDLNGDGKITTLDMTAIGYPTDPEIIYGFGASMGIKNFDISFFVQGSGRSSFWINENGSTAPFISYTYPGETIVSKTENQLLKAYADSHWSEDNRNIYALWPRLSPTTNTNNNQISTWFMRDGTFLRLKNVEIGYSLPKKLTRRFSIESMRLYVNGSNLASLSSFKLWDVEMGSSGLGYPVQRVFNMGLSVGF
ncbi:SusC/RagA family TonB-linked outer membrane protein [Mucilaginibacter sp. AW1-3]